MKIFLQRLCSFDSVICADLETRSLCLISKQADPSVRNRPFGGWYALADGTFIGFYRHPQTQHRHLWIGDRDLELTGEMLLQVQPIDAKTNNFVIYQGPELVLRLTYSAPKIDEIDLIRIDSGDIEHEDFDLFLLAANIWNTPTRRNNAADLENNIG